MKNVNRLLGMIFVGIASTALFVACSDSEGESCLTDTDCVTDFVCESEICVQTCATAANCPAGDECVPRSNGAENICVQGNNPNNVTNNNETNNTATNNTSPIYSVALIKDTTMGAGCDGDDPGSDLSFMTLETEEGEILGYANARYLGIIEDGNEFSNLVLNGEAPDFGPQCPTDFNINTVTSLGCGGEIGVQFLDIDGTPVFIEEGMQIRVMEYGGLCGGSTDDSYEVFLCTDATSVINDDNTASCTVAIGGGEGDITLGI